MKKVLVPILIIIAIFMTSPVNANESAIVNNNTIQQNIQQLPLANYKTHKEKMIAANNKLEKARENKIKWEKKQKAKKEAQIEQSHWSSIGSVRITTYCPCCNSPKGYQSSSGTTLYEGCVACNWLPIGTRVRINGTEYTVMDTCGTDAIDIFVDTPDGCHCDTNYYTNVEIYK
jgi:3D (Asp-Asp-Asp) domain-containing protein